MRQVQRFLSSPGQPREACPSHRRVSVMRKDSVPLEEERLKGIELVEDYPSFHERHRIFPALFENRRHKRILDVAAGAGCAAQRIQQNYPAELVCNDASPTAIKILQNMGLNTLSF